MFQHATKVNLFTPRVNTFTRQACNVLYMKLGERIKAARLAAGYKRQKDLSDALGCERATVTMWETDKVGKIGGEYLPALSRLLGRSPEYLQTGKENKVAESLKLAKLTPAEKDIKALQMAVSALVRTMTANAPTEALGFAALVHARAEEAGFSTDPSQYLGEVLRTVELGQRRAADDIQHALQRNADRKAS